MTTPVRTALLFAALAVLITVPLFTKDLWTPDEPRYAEVAREMMVSGDYLVPHLNGNHYDEKPPLQFWMIALASLPAGEVTGVTARIPTVISALVVLWLTFLLARRMYDEQTALWSVLVLITTYQFWWLSHVGQLDMMLTACTTLALYALWRWHESSDSRWFLLFYAGAALGLLVKGPPALVITGLGALAFRWRDRRGQQLVFWTAYPLTLIPVLLWFFAARSGRPSEMSDEMGATVSRQIVGRLFSGLSHAEPVWYYVEKLPISIFPWILFLPWVIYFAWRECKSGPAMRLLLSWTVPALILFHLATGKRALYLLPLYPTFAILVARSLLALVNETRTRWLLATAYIWTALIVVALAGPIVILWTPLRDDYRGVTWAMAGAAVVCGVWTASILRRNSFQQWPIALALQCCFALLVFSVAVFPIVNIQKSARSYCEPVRALVAAGPVTVYSFTISRHEFMFYSQSTHEVVLRYPAVSLFGEPNDRKALRESELLRKDLEAACDSIPVQNPMHLLPAERTAIHTAVVNALRAKGIDGDRITAYGSAVRTELAPFLAAASDSTPTVAYVPQEDWKWIASFLDEPILFSVIRDEKVADRHMLLLADKSALKALGLLLPSSGSGDS